MTGKRFGNRFLAFDNLRSFSLSSQQTEQHERKRRRHGEGREGDEDENDDGNRFANHLGNVGTGKVLAGPSIPK